jgi:hypothetical protein
MSSQSPEVTGGDKPQNHGLSDFKVLPEKQGVGPLAKKPEEPEQQLSEADLEVYKQLMGNRWGSTVFENPIRVPRPLPQNPGEQRGERESFQPNPGEHQIPQRRRTRRERARLAQDPELRGLAKELFGDIGEQGVSEFIAMAVRDYPELPPDEALREFDRERRENPNRDFTFS